MLSGSGAGQFSHSLTARPMIQARSSADRKSVVGEPLASNKGLGFLIQVSTSTFNPAGIFGVLMVLATLAAIFNIVILYLEGIVLRWKRLER